MRHTLSNISGKGNSKDLQAPSVGSQCCAVCGDTLQASVTGVCIACLDEDYYENYYDGRDDEDYEEDINESEEV